MSPCLTSVGDELFIGVLGGTINFAMQSYKQFLNYARKNYVYCYFNENILEFMERKIEKMIDVDIYVIKICVYQKKTVLLQSKLESNPCNETQTNHTIYCDCAAGCYP